MYTKQRSCPASFTSWPPGQWWEMRGGLPSLYPYRSPRAFVCNMCMEKLPYSNAEVTETGLASGKRRQAGLQDWVQRQKEKICDWDLKKRGERGTRDQQWKTVSGDEGEKGDRSDEELQCGQEDLTLDENSRSLRVLKPGPIFSVK